MAKKKVPDVRTLIARRMAGKKDHYKLAVIAEGGSLKGVVSMGFLARMEEWGLNKVVDMWGGTSSGGLNIAYAAAGRARLGVGIYGDTLGPRGFFNDGKGPRFFSLWRMWLRPMMDVERLVDVVFSRVKPLDYRALAKLEVPTWVTASGRDGKLHVLRLDCRARGLVRKALKSTARIPFVAHRTTDRKVLWDGGLSGHNLPLEVARMMGATHVLVLRTTPKVGQASLELVERLLRPLVGLRARDLYKLMVKRHAKYRALAEKMKNDPTVMVLAPFKDQVGIVEQDMAKMWRAAVKAWRQVEREFGLKKARLPKEWVLGKAR